MRKVGRIIRLCLIWAGAVTMPLNGFPRYECRCPSGQVKPLCPGSPSKPTGCCGGECCGCCRNSVVSVRPAKPEEQTSCCQGNGPEQAKHSSRSQQSTKSARQYAKSTKTANSPDRIEGLGCHKTPAQIEVALVVPNKGDVKEQLTAGVNWTAPESCLNPGSLVLQLCRLSWTEYRNPPSTNLVISLQHFII